MLRKRNLLKQLVQVAFEEGLQPAEYETTTCCREHEKAEVSGDKELGKRVPVQTSKDGRSPYEAVCVGMHKCKELTANSRERGRITTWRRH